MITKRIGEVATGWLLVCGMAMLFLLSGCANDTNVPARETTKSGTIHISVDESFKPVIDSQIKVFESLYPEAHILVDYKPEADCLRDLNNDSTRMVIVTRGLTDQELNILKDTLQFSPTFETIAYDAIAVIVNSSVPDSIFTMDEIRNMAKGTSKYPYKILLDGKSATSTVRFVKDSLLEGAPLSKNIAGAENSRAVVDYVSSHTDAVGLIGVSWVGDDGDSRQLTFSDKVRVASIQCRGCGPEGPFVKPYQANIARRRYPMVRPLYYILKENYAGLGSGFANFLIYEKGQLIFRRAYLFPAKMSFQVREMQISQ